MSLSLAQLRAELASRGIRLSKRLGQSFMIDPNLARAVTRLSGAGEGDVALDVGAGAGHLAEALLEFGARVVAVEVDTRLAGFLRERIAETAEDTEGRARLLPSRPTGKPEIASPWGSPSRVPSAAGRVRIVEADALSKGDAVSPIVIEALREELGAGGRDSFVVASNLPYNIAATFLIALAGSGLPWSGGAVTIQREVAERLAASPGSKTYGASSVLWQLLARGRVERVIGREVFWPRPEVDSALFVIEPKGEVDVAASDPAFAGLVRALFSQRRKVLRKSVAHAAGTGPEEAEAALAEAGLDPSSRVERAAPEAVLALWRAVGG